MGTPPLNLTWGAIISNVLAIVNTLFNTYELAESECLIVSNFNGMQNKVPIIFLVHPNKIDYIRALATGQKQITLSFDVQCVLNRSELEDLSEALLNAINGINTGVYQVQKGRIDGKSCRL